MQAHRAFTLFEMVLVIALAGILSAVFLTRIARMKKSPENWTTIADQLNRLATVLRQEAITTGKQVRLTFLRQRDDADKILLEQEEPDPEHPGKMIYGKLSAFYADTEYLLPADYRLEGVYRGKENLLPERKGQASCYVQADGLMEDVTLRMVKTDGQAEQKTEELYSYTLNPFLGTFDGYEGKVKPE